MFNLRKDKIGLIMLSKDFQSGAEAWLDAYEDSTFEKQVESILEQLKPLYLQLHG